MCGYNNNKAHFWLVVRRFYQDQAGSYAVIFALMLPVLVGLCGLGTEVGVWFLKQRDMQGAADTGAVSAATANPPSISDLELEADSVASSNGYTNGVSGTQVTVNRPPLSGAFTAVSDAVEVIVQQPQKRLMSAFYGNGPVLISARAVAVPRPGKGCVLALDPTLKGAAEVAGTANVGLDCGLYSNSVDTTSSTATDGGGLLTAYEVRASGGVNGQDNITTAQGIFENQLPTADPYADVTPDPMPSTCTVQNSNTLTPGNYCDGITVNAGQTVTLAPGIYWFDGKKANLKVNGGGTLKSNGGVTLVFTGSGGHDWATASINGGATVELSALTTGWSAGIVVYGDRAMTTGTQFTMNGGSAQNFAGAIYLPRAALNFTGGSGSKTSCTQIVTDTIKFSGNAHLSLDCGGIPVDPFGADTAQLVE